MEHKKHILIIEDDESILFGLKDILEKQGYIVSAASNGLKGFEMAIENVYDLMILDIMLPGMDGMEICRRIRKQQMKLPILMLTAKSSEIDKISGLDQGSDDYMTKPFSLSELLARIRALLRRAYPDNDQHEQYEFDEIKVYFNKMEVWKEEKEIKFTKKEFAILEYMIRHEGEVVHRHDLLNSIWGYENMPTTRTVDTFIAEIRKKLETVPSNPKYITSISGVGYKFTAHK